jgi:heme exporter protein B
VSAVAALIARDLRVAGRRLGEVLTPPLFFVVVATIVPLGLEPAPELLAQVAPGIVWTGALLASLLGLERLFATDHDDGSLEQLVLAPAPLALLVLGKVAAHWAVTGLPLLLVAPLAAELLALPHDALPTLLLGLALGTPTLALLGALGAALTVSARRSALLLPLLVLPLAVPLLIFGAGSLQPGGEGGLALCAAASLVALALGPFAGGAALRALRE